MNQSINKTAEMTKMALLIAMNCISAYIIIPFLAAAVIISALRGIEYNFKRYALVSIGLGIPVIYLLGAMQLKFVTGMDWTAVIMTGVLPFIPLDIVKCLGAVFLAGPIQRVFKR